MLEVVGSGNNVRKLVRDFRRVRIDQAKHPQLGDIGHLLVNLLHHVFNGGQQVSRGADDQRIGAVIRHGDHFRRRGATAAPPPLPPPAAAAARPAKAARAATAKATAAALSC